MATNTETAVMPAPSGYVVDFDNPETRTGAIYGIYVIWVIGLVFSCASVAQRFYVKAFIRNKLGFDDAILLLGFVSYGSFALLTNLASQIIVLLEVVHGEIGVHLWEITTEKFYSYAFLAQFLDPVLYAFPPWFCKIAVLMFFLEIGGVSRSFRLSVFITMFVVTASGISILFYSIFQCYPIRAAWDSSITGVCINRVASYKATAILGVITDAMIIVIPVPLVMGLKMSWQKKFGLMALFGLGSLTLITSVVRLVLLMELLVETDVTWNTIVIDTWIVIEGYLLVICASASTFRLFLRTVAPGVFSTTQPSTNYPAQDKLGVQTIGSSGPKSRRRYSKFDDITGTRGLEMDRFEVEVKAGPHQHDTGRKLEAPEERPETSGDAASEELIIHKTTLIEITRS